MVGFLIVQDLRLKFYIAEYMRYLQKVNEYIQTNDDISLTLSDDRGYMGRGMGMTSFSRNFDLKLGWILKMFQEKKIYV